MNINWQQILGGCLIAGITWTASQFLSAQSEIAVIKQQMDTIVNMMKEVRQDQREQQKLYALKSDIDRLEKRLDKLEK